MVIFSEAWEMEVTWIIILFTCLSLIQPRDVWWTTAACQALSWELGKLWWAAKQGLYFGGEQTINNREKFRDWQGPAERWSKKCSRVTRGVLMGGLEKASPGRCCLGRASVGQGEASLWVGWWQCRNTKWEQLLQRPWHKNELGVLEEPKNEQSEGFLGGNEAGEAVQAGCEVWGFGDSEATVRPEGLCATAGTCGQRAVGGGRTRVHGGGGRSPSGSWQGWCGLSGTHQLLL